MTSPEGKIAIVAGNGELPRHIFDELKAKGELPLLIGIDKEIDHHLAKASNAVLTFGQIGKLFQIFEKEGVKRVIFAGGVSKRPDFKDLKLDLLTVKELPTLLKIVMGGDNIVLEKIARYFEKKNMRVVGCHEIAPGLVAENGMIVGRMPAKAAMGMVRQGFAAAKAVGALDAGQAVIVEDGRVIALEGAEGTDAMLERVAALRIKNRLSKVPKFGVLVKCMKPDQDMRADLPAIGPHTVTSVVKAGLKGIVIDAGHSLILDRAKTLELARQQKIFILGYSGG